MRRFIRGVQRLESDVDECDADVDDGAAPDFQTGRGLKDADFFAGWDQSQKRIRQFVKGEELFGSGANGAACDESHFVTTTSQPVFPPRSRR